MILPIDVEKLKKAYEEHSSDRVGLGEASGILPNIDTLACADIDKAIQTAEDLSKVWRPSPEMSLMFEKWMELAKKKQADCNKSITPIPKKKISKNLTPIILITAAVVAGIVVSKIFTNDKQN